MKEKIEQIAEQLKEINTRKGSKGRTPELYPIKYGDDNDIQIIVIGLYGDEEYDPKMDRLKLYAVRPTKNQIQELKDVYLSGSRAPFSITSFSMSRSEFVISKNKLVIKGPIMQEYWSDRGCNMFLRQVGEVCVERTIGKNWKDLNEVMPKS